MLKPRKFGVLFANIVPHAQNWWAGWRTVGSKIPLNSWGKANPLPVNRREQNGWTDFYFGQAVIAPEKHHSLLSATAKVGLHYDPAQLHQIKALGCPSEDIPANLWAHLIEQYRPTHRIWYS